MADPPRRIDRPPPELMGEPLEFIFAEHFRQRQLCDTLERLASDDVFDRAASEEVLEFLQHDLELHVIDEEEDLFPLLRRRCRPEDEIERVLGVLSAEHAEDQALAGRVRTVLEEARRSGRPPAAERAAAAVLATFAAKERRHVALENAVVLPIARFRLSREDLAVLSRRMNARRGVAPEAP